MTTESGMQKIQDILAKLVAERMINLSTEQMSILKMTKDVVLAWDRGELLLEQAERIIGDGAFRHEIAPIMSFDKIMQKPWGRFLDALINRDKAVFRTKHGSFLMAHVAEYPHRLTREPNEDGELIDKLHFALVDDHGVEWFPTQDQRLKFATFHVGTGSPKPRQDPTSEALAEWRRAAQEKPTDKA